MFFIPDTPLLIIPIILFVFWLIREAFRGLDRMAMEQKWKEEYKQHLAKAEKAAALEAERRKAAEESRRKALAEREAMNKARQEEEARQQALRLEQEAQRRRRDEQRRKDEWERWKKKVAHEEQVRKANQEIFDRIMLEQKRRGL